jgi:3'(2'), 5'-bisphosphate nucleotidase
MTHKGLMHANEIARLADALLGVALAAGRVQMAHFATGVPVTIKEDQSPVTAADHESEEIILKGLARAAPGVAVVAEESVTAGRIPSVEGPFFLVDPLDGTKGFIKGRREFTVNIGLIEERRPVFGLIYAPALSELYVTVGPASAAMSTIEPGADVQSFADCGLRPIRTRVPDPNAISALTSQSHLNKATSEFLEGYNVIERRAIASSLKFCLLAKGDADLYPRVGPTYEWDTAAGHAILAAAGGTVTRLDGQPLLYGNAERRFESPDFVAWGRGPLPRQARG